MKALTLWQPWASLVALGEKSIETRSWSTKYRGPLVIHSAASVKSWLGPSRYSEEFQVALASALARHDLDPKKPLPLGCVLCTVILLKIEPTEEVRDGINPQERVFGNYDDGRYAWHMERSIVFPKPIPAKGNRMLWNWTAQ